MLILYFFIGFIAAIIASIPPGAVNIAVINTSVKTNIQRSFIIILGAAVGEVLLSFIALHCTMSLASFFKENPWVQVTVFLLFLVAGIFFLLKDKVSPNKSTSIKIKTNRLIKGFLLAVLNPPVLIFWVIAFTVTQKYMLSLSDMSPWLLLLLFFTGVFTGKTTVLYGYGKWGKKLTKGKKDSKKVIHRFIGIALILVGLVQSIRFFIES